MKSIIAFFCLISFAGISQVELHWSILHPLKKEWIDLGEKGSVQEALINSGELPNPFYGMNEHKFGWIENHLWRFKSSFSVTKSALNNDFLELEFPSLDTYAEIYLNDSLILTTENAFIPHSVQIKDLIHEGENEIEIVFTPPVIYHKKMYENASYHLPAPNDVGDIPIASYTRKPQYQFGWDWALRINTMGINKPAILHAYNISRISNKSMRTVSIEKDTAVLEFDLFLSNNQVREVVWESKLFKNEKVTIKNGKFTRRVVVAHPELWWPRGQGKQSMDIDFITIKTIDNQLIDSFKIKFGIKTSRLIQEKDEWGTSYYFKINGRTIFSKGADYIPQDIFPTKVTDSAIISMVETMAESNFNMVRVWGGGYYPDEVFFEKCDELGIMVWQDFMFACAMYPGDAKFTCNVKGELKYQLPRIAAHPSVVLFNGNNEVDVAWKNWGFQGKYNLFGKKATEIEDAYNLVFKEIAPSLVQSASSVPYIHTSPLSNWGKDEYYNHGSQHYWGVWHGKDPLEDFGKKIGRFNAEYGFQSFPEYNTLMSFSEESDWSLKSDVMKHHQKSYVGNGMILKHTKLLYGEPKTFEEFVYFSQLTQARAVSMAIAGHRIDAPRCGGTLYWQMNDCWPAPSWSSIDYYGNWKALQYKVKKDYQDVAIVAKYDGLNDKTLFIVSDSPDNKIAKINIRLISLEGDTLLTKPRIFKITQGSSFEITFGDYLRQHIGSNNCVISIEYSDDQDLVFQRNFDFIGNLYEKANADDIQLFLEKNANYYSLKIKNSKFVRNLWISASKPYVKFSRNFESLTPGVHLYKIEYEGELTIDDLKLMWQ